MSIIGCSAYLKLVQLIAEHLSTMFLSLMTYFSLYEIRLKVIFILFFLISAQLRDTVTMEYRVFIKDSNVLIKVHSTAPLILLFFILRT